MDTQQCPFCGLVTDVKSVVCAACGLPFAHEGVQIRRTPPASLQPPARPWVRPAPVADIPSASAAAATGPADSSALYDTLAARVRQYGDLRGPVLRSEPGADQPTIIPDPPPPPSRLRLPKVTFNLDRSSVMVLALIFGILATALGTNFLMNRPTPLGLEDQWLEAGGAWVAYTDDLGGYSVDFPAEPTVGAEEVTADQRTRAVTAERLRVRLEARYRELYTVPTAGVLGQQVLDRTPAEIGKAMNGSLRSSFRTSFASLPAVEFLIDTPDQRVLHATAVLTGARLYVLSVQATVDPAVAFQRFASSFKVPATDEAAPPQR